MIWLFGIIFFVKTKLIKVNKENIDAHSIKIIGDVLLTGGLVGMPTETVYGLAANALDKKSAARTYRVKGRPSDNPLIVHIAKIEDLDKIIKNKLKKAELLAEKFWPGPLTMIFEKSPLVPYETTGGLDFVAVRIPKDKIALAVIEAGGGYISAPSANKSGRPSPTAAEHVSEDLGGEIEMIIDGGPTKIGLESTVIDMTCDPPVILRPGAVTKKMIEDVIGVVSTGKLDLSDNSEERPKSPGMKYKHYTPKGKLYIVLGDVEEAIPVIKKEVKSALLRGKKVGIITTDEAIHEYKQGVIKSVGARSDISTIAANLYKVLREFDEENVELIYSESFPIDGIGWAVMNRLDKASGYNYIKANEV